MKAHIVALHVYDVHVFFEVVHSVFLGEQKLLYYAVLLLYASLLERKRLHGKRQYAGNDGEQYQKLVVAHYMEREQHVLQVYDGNGRHGKHEKPDVFYNDVAVLRKPAHDDEVARRIDECKCGYGQDIKKSASAAGKPGKRHGKIADVICEVLHRIRRYGNENTALERVVEHDEQERNRPHKGTEHPHPRTS